MKKLVIFLAGIVVGGAISTGITYFITKKKCEKVCDEEIRLLRNHYDELLAKYETDEVKTETEEDDPDDGIETVGEGLPSEKKINTSATNYAGCYKSSVSPELKKKIRDIKAKTFSAHPTEEDDEDGIYEIAYEDDDTTGEPGFGRKKGYDTVHMTYYADGALNISSWGSMSSILDDLEPNQIEGEEDEIRSDILPYLKEIEFDHGAYDVAYIRDNRRGVDVEVTRVTSSRDIEEL